MCHVEGGNRNEYVPSFSRCFSGGRRANTLWFMCLPSLTGLGASLGEEYTPHLKGGDLAISAGFSVGKATLQFYLEAFISALRLSVCLSVCPLRLVLLQCTPGSRWSWRITEPNPQLAANPGNPSRDGQTCELELNVHHGTPLKFSSGLLHSITTAKDD